MIYLIKKKKKKKFKIKKINKKIIIINFFFIIIKFLKFLIFLIFYVGCKQSQKRETFFQEKHQILNNFDFPKSQVKV